ncbi:MAG: hypothetical protein VYE50_01790, partial [Candidatus Thermoplasmatota archaeon]|nr:hypothetical protein [Candidatus Thermoplasmatota archaeon]
MVNDTDGASTGWKVYNNTITVSNNNPIVANCSCNLSGILRTESSTIRFNTTDVEDPENTHTPSVESRSPMVGSWSSAFISAIEYDSDCQCWETSFTPSASADLGYYDLRFMVEDTDDGSSVWHIYNNRIEVGNNNPDFVNYTLSSSQTLRTGKIAIGANSTDIEDSENTHALTVQYRAPSASGWSDDYLSELYYDSALGHWSTNFTPATTAELGYYDLRFVVNDTDDGTSDWSTYDDVLFVASNPPELTSYSLLNNDIYRTGTSVILVGVYDIEDSNSSMSLVAEHRSPSGNWSSSYFHPAWFNHTSELWSANFTPTIMAELGAYDIRVKVVDLDGGSSNWSTHLDDVTVRNNGPQFADYTFADTAGTSNLSHAELYRSDTISILVNSTDIEDTEDYHTVSVEHRSYSGDWSTEYLSNATYSQEHQSWLFHFTPLPVSELGFYDIRINVSDSDGDSTGWQEFNDVITVLNNIPTLVNHSINSSVLRTNTIILELNASDIEDSEASLEVIVNYRSPAGDWADEQLYNPYYNHEIEAWQVVFAPMESAELGSYDFRVELLDTDGYTWAYNDSVYIFENATEVVNNLPIIETVESSDFQVKPTESITVWIGTMDIEDPGDTHNLSIQYLAPSSLEWSDEYFREFTYNGEKWQIEFVPEPEAEMGIYSVRVAVWDMDNDTSGWFVPDDFDLRVVSNEPVFVDSMIQDPMIPRDGITMIFVTVEDVEDSSQDLDLEFQYSVEEDIWEDAYLSEPLYEPGLDQWSVEFDPVLSAQTGFYEIRVRATDTDGTISDWYSPGSVQVINSPPEIIDSELLNHGEDPFSTFFYRNGTGSVFVYVSDSEDSPDQLVVTVSHRFMEEPWEQSFLEEGTYDFSESRWVFNFEIPFFAQEGEYDFSILVEDLDGEQSPLLEIDNVLFVVNQPPVVLDAWASESLVNEGSSVTFTGESYDDSQVIEHEWSSDLQGFIGNEPSITVDWLTYGVHNISYQVMDNDNIWSPSYSVSIRVNQIPVVEDIILHKYLLHGNESVLAEYLAYDDLGIVAHEWYLDGELWIVEHQTSLSFLVNTDAFASTPASALDLEGAKICVEIGSSYETALDDYFYANFMSYTAVNFDDVTIAKAKFEDGSCDVWIEESSLIVEQKLGLDTEVVPNSAVMPE